MNQIMTDLHYIITTDIILLFKPFRQAVTVIPMRGMLFEFLVSPTLATYVADMTLFC
jgi:hypothetical protein